MTKEEKAVYDRAYRARPGNKEAKKAYNNQSEVREAHAAADKAWKATEEGKISKKATALKVRCTRVGITVEYYDSLPKKCSFPRCNALKAGGMGDWHMDHNKITGKFRGLLCFTHNRKVSDLTLEEAEGVVEYLKSVDV